MKCFIVQREFTKFACTYFKVKPKSPMTAMSNNLFYNFTKPYSLNQCPFRLEIGNIASCESSLPFRLFTSFVQCITIIMFEADVIFGVSISAIKLAFFLLLGRPHVSTTCVALLSWNTFHNILVIL